MKNNDDLPHHSKLGKEGEAYALDYVKHSGYKVLHTNWRYGKKELDIVAIKNETLIIFEVKTRASNYWEDPKDAVKMRKQKNMIEAADAYVHEFSLDNEVQFDVISLVHNGRGFEVEHIPDAFYPII